LAGGAVPFGGGGGGGGGGGRSPRRPRPGGADSTPPGAARVDELDVIIDAAGFPTRAPHVAPRGRPCATYPLPPAGVAGKGGSNVRDSCAHARQAGHGR